MAVQEAKARSDAYTGMLAISLGALLTGCALLYLDMSQYPDKKPETYVAPALSPPARAGGAPAGAATTTPPAAPGQPQK